MRTLVWFRGKDLRLGDHAPLSAALEGGGDVVPLFVIDPFFFAKERAQEMPHRVQFLLEALGELRTSARALGSDLLLVAGRSVEVVPQVVARWGIQRVVAQRWTEPFGRYRDVLIRRQLDVPFDLFEGETLLPPGSLRTGSGTPYGVFTPFAKAFRRSFVPSAPLPRPGRLPALPELDLSCALTQLPELSDLGLGRNPALLGGGETAAAQRLETFLSDAATYYQTGRDRMDQAGTSRLSQDLKFGTLSPRSLWHQVNAELSAELARHAFTNELIWREFAYSTLRDHPNVLRGPQRPEFRGFPWQNDKRLFEAWCQGKTGYPVVDAAQRQLLAEGYVHNRARMVAASFLVKHLLIDYRWGEAHYLKYLTDGDWAINNMGWQWCASTGCDAQPYFRIFNPTLQGQRFDPDGEYVRRWVPELRNLAAKHIHSPWTLPAPQRDSTAREYPAPIVEHGPARDKFLALAKQHLG